MDMKDESHNFCASSSKNIFHWPLIPHPLYGLHYLFSHRRMSHKMARPQ
jgi:hypothetical protein